MTAHDLRTNPRQAHPRLCTVQGDISDEASISSSIADAKNTFGPINILVANAGIADESRDWPIWETPLEVWKKTYEVNIQGTFLTIKHFLLSAKLAQEEQGKELENLAIVVTGSETGKFGQAGWLPWRSLKTCVDMERSYRICFRQSRTPVRTCSRCQERDRTPEW